VAEVPFRSSGRNPTADRASTELRGVAPGRLLAIDGDFGATRLLKRQVTHETVVLAVKGAASEATMALQLPDITCADLPDLLNPPARLKSLRTKVKAALHAALNIIAPRTYLEPCSTA
jgi:hypothetical protein